MDLDGDGKLDVISGSYWPGDLFVFRGQGGGKYAEGQPIKAKDGKNVSSGQTWKSDDEPDTNSLAASPFAHDWDGDGDLDLLVGNIAGRVILITNEGSREKPAFGKKEALTAVGADICVNGGDAGPFVADWDGDGLADLLVGCGDGSVMFYRNTGSRTAPKLDSGVALIQGRGFGDGTEQGADAPGVRAKICVTDYDGDGRLDLLVGDFKSARGEDPTKNRYDGFVWLYLRRKDA